MKAKAWLSALTLAAAAASFLIWQWSPDRFLRIADGRVISLNEMIGSLKRVRLIFVGEDHERIDDHRLQLKIIEKLHKQGVPLAIGLEMFTAASQHLLDQWVAGQVAQEDFIKGYYREWPMPWPLYRDIFIYARTHAIPLVGLNVPRAVTRKVARQGFSALTPAELRELPTGVSCSVDPAYRAFIRQAYEAHEDSSESFEHFCEAQMLWNMSMGMYLRQYCDRHPGMTVVVLAGAGHAMKRAIPDMVSRVPGISFRVILPELPHRDRSRVKGSDADFLVLRGH